MEQAALLPDGPAARDSAFLERQGDLLGELGQGQPAAS